MPNSPRLVRDDAPARTQAPRPGTTCQVPGQFGLYSQGDHALGGGQGVAFGDGLRCAGGGVVRLLVAAADSGGASSSSMDIPAKAGLVGGETRRYPVWYRDP